VTLIGTITCKTCGRTLRSLGDVAAHRAGPRDARRCMSVHELSARQWSVNKSLVWSRPANQMTQARA
jgi:hypothetical protein